MRLIYQLEYSDAKRASDVEVNKTEQKNTEQTMFLGSEICSDKLVAELYANVTNISDVISQIPNDVQQITPNNVIGIPKVRMVYDNAFAFEYNSSTALLSGINESSVHKQISSISSKYSNNHYKWARLILQKSKICCALQYVLLEHKIYEFNQARTKVLLPYYSVCYTVHKNIALILLSAISPVTNIRSTAKYILFNTQVRWDIHSALTVSASPNRTCIALKLLEILGRITGWHKQFMPLQKYITIYCLIALNNSWSMKPMSVFVFETQHVTIEVRYSDGWTIRLFGTALQHRSQYIKNTSYKQDAILNTNMLPQQPLEQWISN